jgi:uncharacterized cupin superfamily protein
MSKYKVKNLKETEDQAVKFGFSPEMEARFPREELESEQTAVSYQRLAPGARQPFAHKHNEDEEIYVVTAGEGQIRLDDEMVAIKQWDAIRVAPETVRGFAAGPDGLEVLAFGSHTPDDVEQQPPDWPE